MTTKNILLKNAFLLLLCSSILVSCKKDQLSDEESELTTAEDHSFVESTFNDVGNIADEAAIEGNLISYKTASDADALLANCATVSVDTVTESPAKIITIDFGSANCTGKDGRSRRGKIIVKHTGQYLDSGATKAVTFDNYFVNDNQVTGTRTIVNNGHNTANNLNWSLTEQGSIILASGVGKITWDASRNRELIEGESTLELSDNVYSITGKASGINAKNLAYTAVISNPLIRKMTLGCRRHFVKGTIVMTPSGKLARTIDFGNGDCDNLATVTVNGKSREITLR